MPYPLVQELVEFVNHADSDFGKLIRLLRVGYAWREQSAADDLQHWKHVPLRRCSLTRNTLHNFQASLKPRSVTLSFATLWGHMRKCEGHIKDEAHIEGIGFLTHLPRRSRQLRARMCVYVYLYICVSSSPHWLSQLSNLVNSQKLNF